MIRTAFVSMTGLMYLTELAQTAQLDTQAELKQSEESLMSLPAAAAGELAQNSSSYDELLQ